MKIGSRIRIKRNIDVTLGLVNGALAKIIVISKDETGQIDTVKIFLKATKKEYSLERADFKFIALDTVCVIKKQFPFVLSYGISIHASQGLSLDYAGIEAGNSIFVCGQTYVGLSRLITSSALNLINFNTSRIK